MIKSADRSAGLLHRGGLQILKKEEEDAMPLARCQEKRKEWAKHWQCGTEVRCQENWPGRNEELKKFEEDLLPWSHQQVVELGAILVVVHANLAVQEVRNIRIIKEVKSWWRWKVGLISSFVFGCNQSKLTSRVFPLRTWPLSTHAGQMRCWQIRIWLQDKTSLERVFQRSTQAGDSPLAAQMSESWPRVPWSNIQHWKCTLGNKMTSKYCHMREKSLAIADGLPWRINCFHEPKIRICWLCSGRLQLGFTVNCLKIGPSWSPT